VATQGSSARGAADDSYAAKAIIGSAARVSKSGGIALALLSSGW
jgi:hypothetical protein